MQLNSFEITHIRPLAKFPSHATHESNEELIRRLGRSQPVDSMVKQLQWAIHRAGPSAPAWQTDSVERLQALLHSHQLRPASHVLAEVACPACGMYSGSFQAMRIHHSKMHGFSSSMPNVKNSDAQS